MRRFFRYFGGLERLWSLYQKLEKRISRFKTQSSIDCLASCGKCCNTPVVNIEATVWETLPLALYLFENNQADLVYETLKSRPQSLPCFFYQPLDEDADAGYCKIYDKRPLLCRLFGFSAVKKKTLEYRYAFCKPIKLRYEDVIAELYSNSDIIPVKMTEYAGLSVATRPEYFNRLSFHEALCTALALVGLKWAHIQSEISGKGEPPDFNPHDPYLPDIA